MPVVSDHGIVCTGEAYQRAVKLTFAQGAALRDPAALFNVSLEGNVRRAIDLGEQDRLDEPTFVQLVQDAVTLNRDRAAKKR